MFVNKLCGSWLLFIVVSALFVIENSQAVITRSTREIHIGERSKRDEPVLRVKGGQRVISSSDELAELESKLVATLTHLSQQEGGAKLELKKLKTASRQTVAGTKYTIEAELSSPEETTDCTVTIVEQLWLDKEESEVTCADKVYKVSKSVTRTRRQIPGGPNQPSEETVKELQTKIVEDLNKLKDQQNGEHFEFVKINNVIERLAAGPIWEGEVELSSKKTNQNHNCGIFVWEQSWINFRETKITCGEKTFRMVKGQQR